MAPTRNAKAPIPDFLLDFTAGGISASITKTLVSPWERMKLIIQTQDANPLIKSGDMPRYTGMKDCFSRVYKSQGFGGLWRGNLVNVIRYAPTQALNFALFDRIRLKFPNSESLNTWRNLGACISSGALAGAGSLCLVYPLDHARVRLEADAAERTRVFTGLRDYFVKTGLGPNGVGKLYSG